MDLNPDFSQVSLVDLQLRKIILYNIYIIYILYNINIQESRGGGILGRNGRLGPFENFEVFWEQW